MSAPELACCKPIKIPFPSGLAWAHTSECPKHPRQKVRPGEDHPVFRNRNRSSWWSPTPYAGKAAEVIAFKAHTGRWR